MDVIYDWCVASSANFCKGVATIKSLRTTALYAIVLQVGKICVVNFTQRMRDVGWLSFKV